jgi:two-component system, NtrC family, C4-dicarboxylate transport sensor histidine kinase DctB
MMARWMDGLQRDAWRFHVLALLLSLAVGFGVSQRYAQSELEHYRLELEGGARRAAAQLESETVRGEVMGMARLLGFNEPLIRQLALGLRPPDDPEVLARLRPVRRLSGADAIFVVDARGVVVAYEGTPPVLTGQSVFDQLYWQLASSDVPNVYPAVESNTGQRVLFHSVPIIAGGVAGGDLLGALVLRLPASRIDEGLRSQGRPALLLSPAGVVFAATDSAWLFHFEPGTTHDERLAVSNNGQFGRLIAGSEAAATLPFDPRQPIVRLDGRDHLPVRSSLQWKDPRGRWSLVVLGQAGDGLPVWMRSAMLLAVAGIVYLVLLLLHRGAVDLRARREALARSEAATREASQSAQRLAQLSTMTLQLQDARSLEALAHSFFQSLDRMLPVQQGSLYFLDPASDGDGPSKLRLAGSYATTAPPQTLALGEGLLGQCALDQRPVCVREVPPGFWRVATAGSEALPRSLLLLPITRQSELLGVLEIASLGPELFDGQDTIEGLLPVLGLNLEILLAERRLEHLLQEARASANDYRLQQAHSQAVEAWYQAVLFGAPDGILVVDGSGEILLANRAAHAMFGYDEGEMTGMAVERLVPAEARGSHAGLRQAFSEPGRHSLDASGWRTGLEGERKDGRKIPLAISLASIPATALRGPCVCAVIANRKEAAA